MHALESEAPGDVFAGRFVCRVCVLRYSMTTVPFSMFIAHA